MWEPSKSFNHIFHWEFPKKLHTFQLQQKMGIPNYFTVFDIKKKVGIPIFVTISRILKDKIQAWEFPKFLLIKY